MKKVIITGANGFIGKALVHDLMVNDYFIYALSRVKMDGFINKHFQWIQYELDHSFPSNCKDADVCIHCAFAPYTKDCQNAFDLNVNGSIQAQQFCHKHNIKFIFLSSFSAHEKVSSIYGQQKLTIERKLDHQKDLMLKLGLVLGDEGLGKRIENIVKKVPLIPIFDGGHQKVQTIDIETLLHIVRQAIKLNIRGLHPIASPEKVTFKNFLKMIAKNHQKKRVYISLPSRLILLFIHWIECVFSIQVQVKESIIGLSQLKTYDTEYIYDLFKVKKK